MTVKREYLCNLCASIVAPEQLIGLRWMDTVNNFDYTMRITAHQAIGEADHICMKCLDDVLYIGAQKGFCTLTKDGGDDV